MLKEIVGKIVEAEQKAEKIEREALTRAEELNSQALFDADLLSKHPSKETIQLSEQILLEAHERAEKLANQKLENVTIEKISSDKIDKAAKVIVEEFLRRGM